MSGHLKFACWPTLRTPGHQVSVFAPIIRTGLIQLLCSLGPGGRSLDLDLQQKEQMLRKALIMYLGVASEYTGTSIHHLEMVNCLRHR